MATSKDEVCKDRPKVKTLTIPEGVERRSVGKLYSPLPNAKPAKALTDRVEEFLVCSEAESPGFEHTVVEEEDAFWTSPGAKFVPAHLVFGQRARPGLAFLVGKKLVLVLRKVRKTGEPEVQTTTIDYYKAKTEEGKCLASLVGLTRPASAANFHPYFSSLVHSVLKNVNIQKLAFDANVSLKEVSAAVNGGEVWVVLVPPSPRVVEALMHTLALNAETMACKKKTDMHVVQWILKYEILQKKNDFVVEWATLARVFTAVVKSALVKVVAKSAAKPAAAKPAAAKPTAAKPTAAKPAAAKPAAAKPAAATKSASQPAAVKRKADEVEVQESTDSNDSDDSEYRREVAAARKKAKTFVQTQASESKKRQRDESSEEEEEEEEEEQDDEDSADDDEESAGSYSTGGTVEGEAKKKKKVVVDTVESRSEDECSDDESASTAATSDDDDEDDDEDAEEPGSATSSDEEDKEEERRQKQGNRKRQAVVVSDDEGGEEGEATAEARSNSVVSTSANAAKQTGAKKTAPRVASTKTQRAEIAQQALSMLDTLDACSVVPTSALSLKGSIKNLRDSYSRYEQARPTSEDTNPILLNHIALSLTQSKVLQHALTLTEGTLSQETEIAHRLSRTAVETLIDITPKVTKIRDFFQQGLEALDEMQSLIARLAKQTEDATRLIDECR